MQFFSSTPAVNIISRRNEVKIKVPFGISSVSITTRDAGHDVQKNYKGGDLMRKLDNIQKSIFWNQNPYSSDTRSKKNGILWYS